MDRIEDKILDMIKDCPTTEETIDELRTLDLPYPDKDPEFVTSYIRGVFVEDILKAMEEKNILKIDLAKRLGKSRQYVGRVLNETANFTIESMVEIALALDMKIEIKCEV
jgi:DNA-binding phage protein